MGKEMMKLSDVQDRLRDKVRSAMVDLIPDEAFDEFIKQAWDGFTKPQESWGGYNNRDKVTKPPEIVELLQKEMRAAVQERVKEWVQEWAAGPEADSVASTVMQLCSEAAGEAFLRNLKSGIINSTMDAITGMTTCGNCSALQQTPNANCARCGHYNG